MMSRSNGDTDDEAADAEVDDDDAAAGLPDVEDFFAPILLLVFSAAFALELSFDFESHWLEMCEFGTEILELFPVLGSFAELVFASFALKASINRCLSTLSPLA